MTSTSSGVAIADVPDAVAVIGELIATRRVGAYVAHTFVAPGIAESARPGQLVSLGVGDSSSAIITRRSVPLRSVTPTGVYGGTVEVVLDPDVDAAGAWLASRRLHDTVSILGPLGRGFPVPTAPVTAVVAGVGAAGASLVWLVTELRRRGCHVPRVLVGGSDDRRLLDVVEARRLVGNVSVVVPGENSLEYAMQVETERALRESEVQVMYAAAAVPAMAAMTAAAQAQGVPLQGAFDVPMPCGTGLCRGCLLPVADASGASPESCRCFSSAPGALSNRARNLALALSL